METAARPASWKILLAFAIIYFVWGSTFLAIRVGVHEVPPFLLAGIRFFVSGVVLYAWMRLIGVPSPTRSEWAAATLLGALIFLVDYGCLFWAEQRVPFGNRSRRAGDHSGVHYSARNYLSSYAAAYASGWDWLCWWAFAAWRC